MYDFDNVMTQRMCSSGNKRVPLDLFDGYKLLETQKNSEVLESVKEFTLKEGHSLSDLNLPVHLYSKEELVEVSLLIFEKYHLVEALSTTKETLKALIKELALRYL